MIVSTKLCPRTSATAPSVVANVAIALSWMRLLFHLCCQRAHYHGDSGCSFLRDLVYSCGNWLGRISKRDLERCRARTTL
jgi:hypothetical protein